MRALFVGVLIVCLTGCAGWRDKANKTLLGAESLARASESFEIKYCGDPVSIAKECRAARDKTCAKLGKCETLAKSLYTYRVAILAAQHALIQTEQAQETIQALVAAALRAYQPVASLIGVWK